MKTPMTPTTIATATTSSRFALPLRRKPKDHQNARMVATGTPTARPTRSAVAHGDEVATADGGADGFVSMGPSWIGVDTAPPRGMVGGRGSRLRPAPTTEVRY